MKRGLLLMALVALLAPASAHAAFPGANGKIAFERGGDIWTVNPDGTGEANLTNSPATESNPAWSPDGNLIAIDSNVTPAHEIFTMLADGSGVTQVTDWDGECCNNRVDPAWSPDGEKLAFWHETSNVLSTINVDGTGETPIHQVIGRPYGGAGLVDPEWSPEGSTIAFQEEGGGNCWYGIVIASADGSGSDPLSDCEDFAAERWPSWSPDAQRIVFESDVWCGGLCGSHLITSEPSGANRVDTTVTGYQPAWSPDGTRIAFQDIFGTLRLMNPDGTNRVALVTGALPDWQPLRAGGPQADVLATITDSPDPVPAGELLTYTAQAKNLVGPDDATGVVLQIGLASSAFFVSADPSQGSCALDGSIVTCNLGTLAQGSTATVTVQVEPAQTQPAINATATVGAVEPDPLPGNNTAQAQTTVSLGGYARPKGATPIRVALVPAFRPCDSGSATLTHGPPLEHPSCGSPALASGHLTVGTPDANGTSANFAGHVRIDALGETPPIDPGNGDQADVAYQVSLADVRNAAGLSDYTGELRVEAPLRITDRENTFSMNAPATVVDTAIAFDLPCAATAAPAIGATCSVSTTAEALVPGFVDERKRAIWDIGRIRVLDGGADGDADTSPNTVFAVQGLFVP